MDVSFKILRELSDDDFNNFVKLVLGKSITVKKNDSTGIIVGSNDIPVRKARVLIITKHESLDAAVLSKDPRSIAYGYNIYYDCGKPPRLEAIDSDFTIL